MLRDLRPQKREIGDPCGRIWQTFLEQQSHGLGDLRHIVGEAGEDEPIFRLDQHRFVPGEYVSVTEHDGVQRTFRVVEVIPGD